MLMSVRAGLCCLTAFVWIGPTDAKDPFPVSSGTALAELGAVPPDPPAGFTTSDEAIHAVETGEVPVVNVFRPVPSNVVITSDVEYGDAGDRPLLLDLYTPKDLQKPVPAILFIHGGGWKRGRKEDYRLYGIHFAEQGYVVASVQYRLSEEAPFPAAVHDVKAAVRFLRSEADRLNIVPERIGVAGGSAGGHLSMMVGYSADQPQLAGDCGHPDVSSRVQCVVNLYGPTDLTTPYAQQLSEKYSPLSEFLQGTYAEQPENYRTGSPMRYVTSDDPPTLILHGTVDDLVPVKQADLLASRLAETGVPYVYDRLPGWPHAMDVAQPVNDRCLWYMERFFQRYLRQDDSGSRD